MGKDVVLCSNHFQGADRWLAVLVGLAVFLACGSNRWGSLGPRSMLGWDRGRIEVEAGPAQGFRGGHEGSVVGFHGLVFKYH